MTMIDPYEDFQKKDKQRRREEREQRQRGLWDPRFNPRRASSLPPWAS